MNYKIANAKNPVVIYNHKKKSACPKCGCKDTRQRFSEKGDQDRDFVDRDNPSRIERHCQNCHYSWAEKPIDTATAEGSGK